MATDVLGVFKSMLDCVIGGNAAGFRIDSFNEAIDCVVSRNAPLEVDIVGEID
jgi:hypothetical protein